MNLKAIIGSSLIVLFAGLGLYTFLTSQVTSVPISKARLATETVQAQGAVDFSKTEYDREKKILVFYLVETDSTARSTGGAPQQMKVLYHGEIPGNFEQAKSVTVIGKSGPDGFVAEKMLVKCPSKYQGEDGKGGDDEVREYSSGA